ncbi:MAG: 1-phosphatidylinositol-4-phosphate 5-kinase family protein, partial [archaeon]|nr:1-phosphatidylinositol-4-phosphate 5-kinase family protein [archaeon]
KDACLPLESSMYDEKSPLNHYNKQTLMDNKLTKNLVDDSTDLNFLNVKIRKYSPKIFYHLRQIDGISTEDYLNSLNPNLNLKIIKESFASGGRSSNPIIFTHDKKLLVKTISKEEKDILLNILPELHRRMRDSKSLLCRIYGVFRIEVVGKQCIHVIVMRNMNELPSDSKLFCFDLKGSTVDRSVISKLDKEHYKNGSKEEILKIYKKKILKDVDFDFLGFDFYFEKDICDTLQKIVCEDSEFLRGSNLIDYSLLCSIHSYNEEYEELIDESKKHRIIPTKDKKYFMNLSIIDFLTPYGLTKKFELGFKTANAMVSDSKDTFFCFKYNWIFKKIYEICK